MVVLGLPSYALTRSCKYDGELDEVEREVQENCHSESPLGRVGLPCSVLVDILSVPAIVAPS